MGDLGFGWLGGWMISSWSMVVEKETDATTSKPAVKELSPEEIVFPQNVTVPLPDGKFLPLPSTERDGYLYENFGFPPDNQCSRYDKIIVISSLKGVTSTGKC